MGLLKEMNAAEPYIAYIDNEIVEVKVDVLEDNHLKFRTARKGLDLALIKMHGRYREGYEKEIRELWLRFIKLLYPIDCLGYGKGRHGQLLWSYAIV